MSAYAQAWLAAFGCTLVVEVIAATPVLAPSGAHWLRRAGVVILANFATHPIVWFVFPEAGNMDAARLVAAELFALFVETAAYLLVWPRVGVLRAFAASAVANGASLGAGLVLRALGVSV